MLNIIKSNELIKFCNFISKLLYVLNKQNICNLGKLNSRFYYKKIVLAIRKLINFLEIGY